jgi:hypothetical protein
LFGGKGIHASIEGLYYLDTFSPVAKMTIIQVVLSLAASHNWHLHQLEVNNAFLLGDLNEIIFMKPPFGKRTSAPNQVCRLKKSLYGLKQASRQWYEKLSQFLLYHGFVQAHSDHSLFVKFHQLSFIGLLIYVDDILLFGTSLPDFTFINDRLHSTFGIKDLGLMKYFSCLEVAQSKAGIVLSHRKYCVISLITLACSTASPPLPLWTLLRNFI